ELVSAVGAEDVSTYLQSGNVLFRTSKKADETRGAVERQIADELGLEITVLIRTPRQLARIIDRNPFAKSKPETLHVTFLAAAPKGARAGGLDPPSVAPDEFHVSGAHVYLHCPNGYGRSKLSNTFFERRLGVAATTRNWNTVTQLAELARRL
ncbi:MAG: hypothetical protein C5B48_06330, partial [Candidatus Rokuibacteriota bacterium]